MAYSCTGHHTEHVTEQHAAQKGMFLGVGLHGHWSSSRAGGRSGKPGHEAPAAGGGAQQDRKGFRGWELAQGCRKHRDLSRRLSRLGVLAGCCHLMAAGWLQRWFGARIGRISAPAPLDNSHRQTPSLTASLGDPVLICMGRLPKARARPVMEQQLGTPLTKPKGPFGGQSRGCR